MNFESLSTLIALTAAGLGFGFLLHRNSILRKQVITASRAEVNAVKAESRVQELFDIAPTGLIISRQSDGVVLYVNPKLATQLGGVPADFVGRPAPDFYADPADRERLLSLLQKRGTVQDYELSLRQPDGTQYWASLSASIHPFGDEPAIFSSVIDISQRKESQKVLVEASRNFRDLLQTAPTAIIIADLGNAQILFCNPHAAGLIGLSQDEMTGRSAVTLYRDPQQRQRLIDDLKAGKRIQDVEMEFLRIDGTTAWMRVSARMSRYEERDVVISVWDDITDRRHAERQLRDSEQNLRLAVSSAPFSLIIARSTDRTLLVLNQRANQALKVPPGTDLATLSADDFLDAAVRSEIGQLLLGEAEITDREALIRPCSGVRFWALVSARRIDFEGEPAFILSFADISEHKRIEREIADSRTALRSMINASPIWMAMFDRGGYYQLINRPFEELIGRVAPLVEGRHFTEILPAALAQRHAALINRCIEGEVVEFEEALDSTTLNPHAEENESEIIHVHGKYSPVIAKDGTVSGGVLAMIDITERHEAEETLKGQFQEINRLHLLLKEQVVRDPLTGLFNRRYLDETLDRELARARREGYPISVLMLDIDHFKRLNDTYGHQAGDEVLKALARLLTEGMREGDMPCRYGGEEFTLVLPNATAAVARERAEDWRQRFEHLVTRFGHFELKSTVSVGIAAYPEHGKTRDELIQSADTALYAGKGAGRNTTRIYTPDNAATRTPA